MIRTHFLYLCIVIFTFMFNGAVAQDEEYNSRNVKKEETPKSKTEWKEKLVYGGNLGVWLNGNGGYVQLNPMLGYKVTDWWASGVGFNYTYFGNRTNNSSYYGPTVWTRLRPLKGFYLHTEYNHLRASYYKAGPIPVWLVGGGIFSRGDIISIGFFMLYDVIQHEASPYRGRLVPQGGLLIGF